MANSESQVPPWPAFVKPVLEVLTDGEAHKRRDIMRDSSARLEMPDEARVELMDKGQLKTEDRAAWAIVNSSKAGLIENVSRGVYRITERGRTWLASHPEGISTYAEANREFAEYWPQTKARPKAEAGHASSGIEVAPEVPEESPEEQISTAVADLEAAVAEDLLSRLRESHPDFFEEAVVALLLAMGYGGAEQRGERIGGTGDGGVDGVIDQDALGLDQVYIQAKRYGEGNTVGREAIQAFIGALHGFGASRGVFITTSTFTKQAREYATNINTRVVLIDGVRLTKLMIKYKVGVQVERVYEVVKLDEDFFE